MSKFLDSLIEQAKADKKTILLPEVEDERTLAAAERILAEGIANIILVGDEKLVEASDRNLEGAQIVNPLTDSRREELADLLYETRKKKGMTPEEAAAKVKDPVWYAVMMMKAGLADGLVSGACHATIDILSPSLRVLKTAPGVKLVSSFFIMVVPDCELGENGTFLFSDCGLEVQPDAERLANIAVECVGRKCHDWHTLRIRMVQLANLPRGFKPVHHGHANVHKNGIVVFWLGLREHIHRHLAVFRALAFRALQAQKVFNDLRVLVYVLHN